MAGDTVAPEADPYATRVEGSRPAIDPSKASQGLGQASAASGPAAGPGQRFRPLRKHAAGGLGEIFVAHDGELAREVALKEIKDRFADDPDCRSRFEFEAEVTGGLEHPGIVPVYGLGRYADGRPFYAMRFIRGESLGAAISRFHRGAAGGGEAGERGLELRRLLRRFIDVCNTIEYAHSRGVIHRDIKPDNVMLGPFGETLVVDWGLAKPLDRPESAAVIESRPLRPTSSDSVTMTLAGSTVGTPAFMPPEQAAGDLDRIGPASDVYSLGATLYCLLTGRAPFTGGDLTTVLHKVQVGEFPPPRGLNRAILPGLEAICLKAMALRPEDRYASASALANDVEYWLADEPVSAWREPWSIRTRRWVARHRTLVTSATVALVVGLAAGGYFLYEAGVRRVEQATRRLAEARGRVGALATAEVNTVPGILEQLGADRRLVRHDLNALARADAATPEGRRRRLHAVLALLPDDPKQADYLAGQLRRADTRPDELIVIRDQLRAGRHAAAVSPALWADLTKPGEMVGEGPLRAAAALAAFAPKDPRWQALGAPVTARLVRQNPLLIGAWREAFQPVAQALAAPLRRHYADRGRPEPRALAYTLLFEFATDLKRGDPRRTEGMVELIAEADPDRFDEALEQLRTDRARAVALLAERLEKVARFDDALARRQGRIATALVRLGEAGRVWPLLMHRDDPSVRAEIVHDLRRYKVPVGEVIARLTTEREVSARRALILALGVYDADPIPAGERQVLAATLLAWYRDDPDPGVHGGVDWLLRRRWGLAQEIEGIDKDLASKSPPAGRDWYVDGRGHTYAIARGPVEFTMGSSPESDPDRDADETPHRVRIERSFAIATKEVTVADYTEFLQENPEVANFVVHPDLKSIIPTPDCAMVVVDWYDAARYCNWLSRKEGLPEDQWCYPKAIGPGMTMPPDWLKRTGYRLPTEAEWEYACRAGAASSRPYGGSQEQLPEYGWFLENAGRRMHPVGLLKPNDLGLFDFLGNAFEWLHDAYVPYTANSSKGEPLLDAGVNAVFRDTDARVLRGGSFLYGPPYLRSGNRVWFGPATRYRPNGFRLARTYP